MPVFDFKYLLRHQEETLNHILDFSSEYTMVERLRWWKDFLTEHGKPLSDDLLEAIEYYTTQRELGETLSIHEIDDEKCCIEQNVIGTNCKPEETPCSTPELSGLV